MTDYKVAREYDTILAALRCLQAIIEDKVPGGAETQEWAQSIKEIAENGASHDEVNSEYIEDLIETLGQRYLVSLRNSKAGVSLAATGSALDLLDVGRLLILGGDDAGVWIPGRVLEIDRAAPMFKVLYDPVMATRFGVSEDENKQHTVFVDVAHFDRIGFVGVPHPKPELESWAVFDVNAGSYADAIDNGAIPALSESELEARIIAIATEASF